MYIRSFSAWKIAKSRSVTLARDRAPAIDPISYERLQGQKAKNWQSFRAQ